MVAVVLTQSLIEEGKSLLEVLDDTNFKAEGAFWYHFPDQEKWKLVISLKGPHYEGPKNSYERIQRALSKLKDRRELSLEDVMVVNRSEPLLSLLGTLVKTGDGISGIRLRNNVVNGRLVDDAYIYRLNRKSA